MQIAELLERGQERILPLSDAATVGGGLLIRWRGQLLGGWLLIRWRGRLLGG